MSRHFGRYLIRDEVADELGRGGFGRVYRAFDPNLNDYVAIKVLYSAPDDDMVKRFEDESRTTSRLKHENIVKVYNFDLQDGMPYLVMELLDGQTLDKVIKSRKLGDRPLEFLDKVEIMFQVAKGLQYAHGENVIHRDIKAANIMVLRNGVVKIMDFGIARVVDKEGTRRTRQGNVAGTVISFGPEQFKGVDADKLTDLFAYGGVFYEVLAGEHPFAAKDQAMTMYRIITVDPPPIRSIVPECPEALDSLIRHLLAKDRELRVAKMEDVIRVTQPILIGLRQERAAAIAAGIQGLVQRGLTDQAQVAAGQVLDLDPLNKLAQHWLQHLSEQSQLKTKRAMAEARVRESEEHAAAGRFDAAVQSMESAISLDSSSPALQAHMERLKVQAGQVRDAARLVGEARAERQQGNLDAAMELAGRAIQLDTTNPEARRFRQELGEQMRGRREAAEIARADELRLRGQFAEALAVLDGLAPAPGSGSRVAALRAIVERDQSEAERQKRNARFRMMLSAARDALYSQRVEEAEAAAENLCREFPDEPSAEDFQSEVREYQAAQKRLSEVGRVSQTARVLIRSNQLDEARDLLEGGLRSYPGDTTMNRLMEMVESLGVARERVRQVNEIASQARALLDARRIDEASALVESALLEFGQETDLVECKRSIEFEKEHREHLRGLQKRLEDARRLLAEDRAREAVDLLEETSFRYPGEPDVPALLSSARLALAAAVERDHAANELRRIAPLEAAQQFSSAIAIAETALERYPRNPQLRTALERLQRELEEHEREQAVAAHVNRVEEAVRARQWDAAETGFQAAQAEFPQHPVILALSARIGDARRRADFEQFRARIESGFERWDLQEVRRQLEETRAGWSHDAEWQALWLQLESRLGYQAAIAAADQACRAGNYEEAERMLQPLLSGAPDGRAAQLRQTVAKERLRAEELIRQEAEKRIQQEAAERARLERERTFAASRQQAAELLRTGNLRAAAEIFNRLVRQSPGDNQLRQELEAAEALLAEQVRSEETRRAAVATGRKQAAESASKGDYAGAISFLDELARQFPGYPEIAADRLAAAKAMDARQRESEQLQVRERSQAISQGRTEAARLVGLGQFQNALAVLDALAQRYPDQPQIADDRTAAVCAWDTARRQAEQRAQREKDNGAIAKGFEEAAAQVLAGDCKGAIARLEALDRQYPARPEIAQEKLKAQRIAERQMREAEDRAQIDRGRDEAAALVRAGEFKAAVALLDRLRAQFPRNVELKNDRDAAARAAGKWKDDTQARAQRALEALTRRSPPPTAEDRLREALKHVPAKPRTGLDRIRGFFFGLLAQTIALGYLTTARLFGGRKKAARLPERAAVGMLRRLDASDPGNPRIQAARRGVTLELDRRGLAIERVKALSPGDSAAILSGVAIGVLLLLAGTAYFVYEGSRVEVKAKPDHLEFSFKVGSAVPPQEVVLSRDVDCTVSKPNWLNASKSLAVITVTVANPVPAAPLSLDGKIRVEFHSHAAKNAFLDIPVSMKVLPKMKITPDTAIYLVYPGSFVRQLKVANTKDFTVLSDRPWLIASQKGDTILLSADARNMLAQGYWATLKVKDKEDGSEVALKVGLTVLAQLP